MNTAGTDSPRPNPYEQYGLLFGREADTQILVDKTITHRLTLLFAPSGSGKTAFLKDSFTPWLQSPLKKNLNVVYFDHWGHTPLAAFKDAIQQSLQAAGVWPEGATQSLGDSQELVSFLEFCTLFTRHPLIIILDQFEQLFRHQDPVPPQHIRAFVEQLTMVITASRLPVRLLLSMQEDAALELQTFAREMNKIRQNLPLMLFDNYYRLRGITRKAALQAIRMPVKETGFQYEEGLPERIVADLLELLPSLNVGVPQTDADAIKVEPTYLQMLCAQLWKLEADNPDKYLHLATYRAAGGIAGLLQKHIHAVLDSLPVDAQQVVRRAFACMVSRKGERISHTPRGLAELLDIPESTVHDVFKTLLGQRIVRYRQFDDESWYGIYHDLLVGSILAWNRHHPLVTGEQTT